MFETIVDGFYSVYTSLTTFYNIFIDRLFNYTFSDFVIDSMDRVIPSIPLLNNIREKVVQYLLANTFLAETNLSGVILGAGLTAIAAYWMIRAILDIIPFN